MSGGWKKTYNTPYGKITLQEPSVEAMEWIRKRILEIINEPESEPDGSPIPLKGPETPPLNDPVPDPVPSLPGGR